MNGRGALGLLKWAEGELARSGIKCAKRDAEALLIHSCRIRREDIFLNNPEPRSCGTNLFKHYVKQRAFRRPLQYILKSAEFMGNPLMLEEGVFIPRPETELLVEKVLERVKAARQKDILEIGTGSGNIAISLTKNTTHCKIITCDISEKALEIASKNAGINGGERANQIFKEQSL